MKGLKGVDPTKEPNDLVVFLAVLGWAVLLAYLIGLLVNWLSSITWFV
jgi:hypothetical protein